MQDQLVSKSPTISEYKNEENEDFKRGKIDTHRSCFSNVSLKVKDSLKSNVVSSRRILPLDDSQHDC
jgi:hypothetical protein